MCQLPSCFGPSNSTILPGWYLDSIQKRVGTHQDTTMHNLHDSSLRLLNKAAVWMLYAGFRAAVLQCVLLRYLALQQGANWCLVSTAPMAVSRMPSSAVLCSRLAWCSHSNAGSHIYSVHLASMSAYGYASKVHSSCRWVLAARSTVVCWYMSRTVMCRWIVCRRNMSP